jgi:N utilization substance protein B
MLYQWEVGGRDPDEVVRSYWSLGNTNAAGPELVEPGLTEGSPLRAFASELMQGTVRSIARIDPLIAAHTEHWRLSRIAVVDRAILRLAIHELMEHPDTPPSVVINEALELTRLFSTEEAVGFVNGVLDAVNKSLADDDEAAH